MKVFCGYLDPILCMYQPQSKLNSEKDYWDYVSSLNLGEVIYSKTVDGKEFGFTNDGCFYLKHDWLEHDPINDFIPTIDFLTRYILFPLQRTFYMKPLKQLEPVGIYRGQINPSKSIEQHIHSFRHPTGSSTFDRFKIRNELNDFLKKTPQDQFQIESKMWIQSHYPHANFATLDKFDTSLQECLDMYVRWPDFRIDLLSIFMSSASNAQYREAYYFGIMFLESFLDQLIYSRDNTWGALNPKAYFSTKAKHVANKGYLTQHGFIYHTQEMIDLRNDLFHRAAAPQMQNLFNLHEAIHSAVVEGAGFQISHHLGIHSKHI